VRRLIGSIVGLCAVVGTSAAVWAQEAQNQFVPADSVARPELSPGPLLYGAYAFVWVALLVYVFALWTRIGRVERELGEIRRRLQGK
jgi:CcmD family protein